MIQSICLGNIMVDCKNAKTLREFYADGDYFVTMIDPAGHPFCLCVKD